MSKIGPAAAAVGQYRILGDVELHPSAENIVKLLKYLFGAPTTVQDGASGRYKHTFDPSDVLKYGTFYKLPDMPGVTTNALQYTSVIVTEGSLEAALGDPVTLTFTCLGQKDAKVTAPTLGTIPTVRQFFSLDGKVYWDLAQTVEIANIDSISCSYAREIPDDFYSMNDVFLKGFIPGVATFDGEMDLLFTDWIAYEKFWGATGAPVASPTPVALDIDFKGETLGGTGDWEKYRLRIQAPKVLLKSIDDPVEARDKVMQTVAFEAYRGLIDSTEVLTRWTLYNKIATA